MWYSAAQLSTIITSTAEFLFDTSILSLFFKAALFFVNLPSHLTVNMDLPTDDSL